MKQAQDAFGSQLLDYLNGIDIDISPLAIEVCRRRGLCDARIASVTQLSRRWGTFDTILMLGNNFGLLANARRARWLLRRLAGMTSPQAGIIAGSADPYETSDPVHLAYHRRNRERGRMSGQVRIRVRYRNLRGPLFGYLLASKTEMSQLLEDTGWAIGRFLDAEGPYYLAIIEKQDS